jgi:hypothetical protein
MVLAHAHELDNGNISEINIISNEMHRLGSLMPLPFPNVQLVLRGKLGVAKVMDGYAAIAVQELGPCARDVLPALDLFAQISSYVHK